MGFFCLLEFEYLMFLGSYILVGNIILLVFFFSSKCPKFGREILFSLYYVFG